MGMGIVRGNKGEEVSLEKNSLVCKEKHLNKRREAKEDPTRTRTPKCSILINFR